MTSRRWASSKAQLTCWNSRTNDASFERNNRVCDLIMLWNRMENPGWHFRKQKLQSQNGCSLESPRIWSASRLINKRRFDEFYTSHPNWIVRSTKNQALLGYRCDKFYSISKPKGGFCRGAMKQTCFRITLKKPITWSISATSTATTLPDILIKFQTPT